MNFLSRKSIALFSVVVTLAGFALIQLTPIKLGENLYEDFLITASSASRAPSDKIVVIEVRDSTLAEFPYSSPLDRGFLSKLINKLANSGVRAIGIDIIFDQPSEADKDAALKSTLRDAADLVFTPGVHINRDTAKQRFEFQESFLNGLQKTSIVLAKGRNDGVVRNYLGVEKVDGVPLQQLAAAMASIPVAQETDNYKRIYYQSDTPGIPNRFKTYPAEAALHLPAEWFRDKYVLIGKNIENIDQFRTPYSTITDEEIGTMPGVQIHAHILNQLLSGIEISEQGWFLKLVAMYVGSLAGIFLVLRRVDVWIRSAIVIATVMFLLGGGYFIFKSTVSLLPMFAASFSLLVSSIVMSGFIWQRDRSQKQFIRQAWSRYVSKNVVDVLITNPETLKLGGKRITASFIFTDIEGFTKLSEGLEPEKLSEIINDYLDIMTEEFKTGGATIDKIVGDAIVGFIGAPLEEKEHANKAVALAIRLDQKSRMFQQNLETRGIHIGKTRIGINTGPAVIGNFGGNSFFDYTALGDAVNIAARLEGANKKIGSSICVSGETVRCANKHNFRPIGNLYVEGKANIVETWEPVSESETHLSGLDEYKLAYEKLEKGMKGTIESFQNLAEKFPADHLVKFHLDRLRNKQTGTRIEISK